MFYVQWWSIYKKSSNHSFHCIDMAMMYWLYRHCVTYRGSSFQPYVPIWHSNSLTIPTVFTVIVYCLFGVWKMHLWSTRAVVYQKKGLLSNGLAHQTIRPMTLWDIVEWDRGGLHVSQKWDVFKACCSWACLRRVWGVCLKVFFTPLPSRQACYDTTNITTVPHLTYWSHVKTVSATLASISTDRSMVRHAKGNYWALVIWCNVGGASDTKG